MWSLHWRFSLCFEMEVCVFSSLLTVLCVGLFGRYTYAADCYLHIIIRRRNIAASSDGGPRTFFYHYTVPPRKQCTVGKCMKWLVVTPSSLLVEYGNPAEVNCSISNRNTALTNYQLGVEAKSLQRFTRNESVVMWKVDSLTNWEEDKILCSLTVNGTQCTAFVNINIYKTPDSVTLSSVPDVMVERNQTQLWCQIENVGPGYKLSVHWSRADPKQNNFTQFNETLFPDLENEKKSVNKTAYLTIIPSREDDGAKYLCEAVLNLDQTQMKNKSQPITITVQYTDHTGIITLIIVLVSIMVLGALAYSMWRMYYHRTQMASRLKSREITPSTQGILFGKSGRSPELLNSNFRMRH